MGHFLNAFALLLLAYIGNKLYLAFLKPNVANVPGPLLAKFTDLYCMYLSYRSQRSEWLQDLHRQHGTLVRTAPNRFSVSDPKDLKQIYEARRAELPKSDQMTAVNNVIGGQVRQGIVGTKFKEIHSAMRKPVANVFSMTGIMQYEPLIDNTINVLLKRLDEEFVEPAKACAIDRWLHYFSYDVITAVTLSTRQGFLDEGGDVDDMLTQLEADNMYKGLMINAPWAEFFFRKNPLYIRFFNAQSKMIRRITGLVTSRLGNESKTTVDGQHDMLSRFIDIHQQKPQEVPAPRLMVYVATNLLAGSDTTAITFRSVVYRCLKSPHRTVFKRIQNEIDGANLSMPVPLADALKLPYLDAVVKESLRMHFVGNMTLEREVVNEPLKLCDGRILPVGAFVGSSGLTVHFDKGIFGADADTFNPDRWLQSSTESAESYAERLHGMRTADMSWGMGSRACLGKNIAIAEVYKTLATLFGLLDMGLVDPDKEWTITEKFFRIQSDMDINIRWRPGKDSMMPSRTGS